MTVTVVVMILLGIAFVIASFIVTEKLSGKEENYKADLLTVDDDYQFSDRELQIIKRKIEDVIAKQAKDILYETNESLSSMANEKTMALGDYAVSVCDEIEKNHKEVMFLYSMLDDKQKEIMKTVKDVDDTKHSVKELLNESEEQTKRLEDIAKSIKDEELKRENKINNDIMYNHSKGKAEEVVHVNDKKNISAAVNDNNKKNINAAVNDNNKKNINVAVLHNNKADNDNKQDRILSDIDINNNIFNDDSKLIDELTMPDDKDHTDNNSYADNNDFAAVNDFVDNIDDIFAELDKTDINFDEVLENEFKDDSNANDIILEMYNSGRSVIEIAKELGLGVGEVKLVIDLYQGE